MKEKRPLQVESEIMRILITTRLLALKKSGSQKQQKAA